MNKIYKLKYDRRRQQLVAVSELTTGAGKEATGQVCGLSDISSFRKLLGTLTPLAFLTGLIVSLLPGMALANPSLPVGGQIVAGQGSISTSGNQMTVNQNTQGMVTNWNSFDIGKNHTVQFVQPGSSAVALNRVTGGHESQILGTLKANGQVMLINPAGVMFGKGAKVNTAGLVASTKNISNEDFMAGRYTFSGGSQPGAEIVNQGSLTTTKGGYIVLAADRVRNQGEIRTPGGRVVLAAADRVTLQLDNTGLTAVSVNGSVVNALAENRGLISATNGQVYLTARGKDMLLNTVVNNSGTVEAKGLSERGGEIVLDGGDSGVVSQSGMLLADSDSGRGGKITLEGQNIHLAGGSLISATGETGGGEVYVGGGWQGKDSSIRHASKVVMDKTAVIDVSAKARGQGGTAVLWSDDYTNFRGTILARGGLQGGDGGRVETSSHHNLQAFGDVDASAVKGNAGEWLLDPFDITVVSGSTDTDVNEGSGNDGIFTPDSGTSQVSNGTINNRLNSGTNVTIKTAKENSGSTQWGNITVNADISHTATNNVSLTLEADGNINITNHNITSTTGKLDVNLLGAGSHDGTITLNNATVSSNGGNITLGQLNAGSDGTTSGLAVSITNSTLNATSAGNISITANNGTTLDNGTLSGNEVSVSASSGTGDALVINNGSKLTAAGNIGLNATVANGNALTVSGGNISAGKDISLTGTAKTGSGYGVSLTNGNMTASSGNISVNGTGYDSGSGALQVNGGNFSAQNTVLEGTAGRNNVGANLTGNINVTQGNLAVTGTVKRTNDGAYQGLTASNLNISVTGGTLSLAGCITNAATSGSKPVALTLTNANLSATDVSLSGTVESGGTGLSLTNTTINATTGNAALNATVANGNAL
ncbi:Two-partner secreted adhesin EtpA, partial [Salmonella enterica subsp. salamae serovar 58:l,z13,z28:z6 str. 00-0163]